MWTAAGDDFASGGVVLALVVLVSDLDDLAGGRRSERLAERDCALSQNVSRVGQSSMFPLPETLRMPKRAACERTEVLELHLLEAEVMQELALLLHLEDGRAGQAELERLSHVGRHVERVLLLDGVAGAARGDREDVLDREEEVGVHGRR